MINFIICEDNQNTVKIVQSYIKEYLNKENIQGEIRVFSHNFGQMIDHIKNNPGQKNVYFFDIDLGENTNGLVLAKEVRKYDPIGYIVFLTGHPELMFKVFQFKLKVLDYICKTDGAIKQRIFECLDQIYSENIWKNNESEGKILTIKSHSNFYNIPYSEIIYFETSTQERKIVLHTKDSQIEFYDTLKNVEESLDDSFYRCHRAYLINLKQIKQLSIESKNHFAVMSNGDTCLVSKQYLKGLKDLCLS